MSDRKELGKLNGRRMRFRAIVEPVVNAATSGHPSIAGSPRR